MKYSLAVVVLFFSSSSSLLGQQQPQVSAFSSWSVTKSSRYHHQQQQQTTVTSSTPPTQLYYNIITPPDDDNCEVDNSNCEESVFDRKKREKLEKDQERRALYAKEGLDLDEIEKKKTSQLSEIDQMATPDQFDNAAGGGIIPGMNLSALMEDD